MTSLLKFLPIRYFIEAKDELKKVAWPSRKTTIIYTSFVIGLSLGLALYLGLLDWALTLLLEALINLTV